MVNRNRGRGVSATIILLAFVIFSGCDRLTKPSIVGKWKAEAGNTIEFFPDGTLKDTALLNTSDGTYVLLDGNRLKTDIEGVLWGSTVTTWKYSVNGNTLTLSTEGGVGVSIEFTRVN